MRTVPRPALIALLVVLLTTWGICPCTMAKVLGIAAAAPEGSVPVADAAAPRVFVPPPC